ncbi:hypothetical protein UM93_04165 [Psychromicrobium lacuslunae]|uniref:Uncharacterized protein n=2 Tax=Psychromicrobium lacuslunae TaxID=1618207 RepID=A0A0D4BWR4_9MICC|nr:hypothetical protein UM93_04165 [Psychromicrobium lacuslunae]
MLAFMGNIIEYFIANNNDEAASAIDLVKVPVLGKPAINAPDSMDPALAIGSLYSLLAGETLETLLKSNEWLELLIRSSNGESFVVKLSDNFVETMKSFSFRDSGDILDDWLSINEIRNTRDQSLAFLRELKKLCDIISPQEHLYCRTSL